MKKGTMYVKVNGLEERYWVFSLVICGVLYYLMSGKMNQDTAAFVILGALAVLVVVRYTILRNWFVRKIDWTLDDETLVFDGEAIPRRQIYDVSFKRNRLSNGTWYLNIDAGQKIRLESLSGLGQSKQSLASMSELADALRPRLKTTQKKKFLR